MTKIKNVFFICFNYWWVKEIIVFDKLYFHLAEYHSKL